VERTAQALYNARSDLARQYLTYSNTEAMNGLYLGEALGKA
jgi:hypothetical protein